MPLKDLKTILPLEQLQLKEGDMEMAILYEGKPTALLQAGGGEEIPRLEGNIHLKNAALSYLPKGLDLDHLNMNLRFNENDLFIDNLQLKLENEPLQLNGRIHDLIPFVVSPTRRLHAYLNIRAGTLELDHFLPPVDPEQKTKKRSKKANKPPFDISHITSVAEGFLQRFNANLNIRAEKISIRGFSASEVALKSRFLSYCDDQSGSGCLLLDTLNARIYGTIPLAASFKVWDLDDPSIDMKMQLSTPLSAFDRMLPPGKIKINSGNIDLAFQYQGRVDDYFNLNELATNASLQGKIGLQAISLDYLSDQYQIRKLSADLLFDEKDLFFQSFTLNVNDNEVAIRGHLYDLIPFLFAEDGKLKASLDIHSPALNFNNFPLQKDQKDKPDQKKAKEPTLITQKVNRMIDFLEADLRVRTGEVQYHDFKAEEVLISGSFHRDCSMRGLKIACVEIDTFEAILFNEIPVKARFRVEDLQDPTITANVNLQIPLADLNAMFPPDQIRFHDGDLDLEFRYHGQPHDHFDLPNDLLKADLSGTARFSKAGIEYISKGYHLTNMDADLSFDNKDLVIHKMSLNFNDNPLEAKGQFHRLFPYIFIPDQDLKASFEIALPELDFEHFSAPAKHQNKSYGGDHAPTPITETVHSMLDHINVNFKLSTDRLKYRNFSAASVYGNIHMDKDLVNIEEVRMNMAEGEFHFKGKISGLENNKPNIDINARFDQTNISQLFRAFENFGQEDLSDENIRGLLDADISFKANADADYAIDPKSMEGRFYFSMKDGELIEFPGLKDIS